MIEEANQNLELKKKKKNKIGEDISNLNKSMDVNLLRGT